MAGNEGLKRILVTGGAGFIGSHVTDAYIEAGYEVAVVDDLSTGDPGLLHPDALFFKGDIRDGKFVSRVFRKFQPQVLNHHAAQMDVRRSVEDSRFDAEVNIVGSLVLLDACVEHGVERVIFASSGGAAYGEQTVFPADETHPTNPVSPYGVSKVAVEKYLGSYHEIYGINFTALRYANVYGPRQNPFGEAGVVAIFAYSLLQREEPVINGDGLQTRDYIYCRDVVAANLAALAGPEAAVVNIGTGTELTVVDIYKGLVDAVGWGGEEVHGLEKPGEQRRSVIDPVLAWETWGWRQQIPLEEGLSRTVRYFRQVLDGGKPYARVRGDSL